MLFCRFLSGSIYCFRPLIPSRWRLSKVNYKKGINFWKFEKLFSSHASFQVHWKNMYLSWNEKGMEPPYRNAFCLNNKKKPTKEYINTRHKQCHNGRQILLKFLLTFKVFFPMFYVNILYIMINYKKKL